MFLLTGCPVGETVAYAIAGELLGRRGAEDKVTLEARIDDLYDDLLVGEADDEAVLGCVVLVLRLCDEALAGVVCWRVGLLFQRERVGHRVIRTVGLALPTSAVLHLEAGEVGI